MNKRIQVIAIILTFPIFVFCQNKFSAGVTANSQISLMTITDSQVSEGNEEKGVLALGYSIGIQAQLQLNEKTFLRSGLNYQNRNNRYKRTGLRFGTDIMNGTESSIQYNIVTTSIGIPVDFGYLIKSKKERINYLIGFGGLININLDTKTNAKLLNEEIDDEELIEFENLAVVDGSIYSLGVFGGIEIELNEKMILGIEPNVRFTPNKFTLHYTSEGRTAIETGITVRIRMK